MSYRDPSIVGQPLTPIEQQVFDLRQAGLSIEDIATQIDYAVGTVGNYVRMAETKKGLRPPMGTGGASPRSPRGQVQPKVQRLADMILGAYNVASVTVQQLTERLTEAQVMAEATDDQRFDQESTNLLDAVNQAQAAYDAFVNMTDEDKAKWLEQRKTAAETRFQAVQAEIGSQLEEATEALEEIVTEAERLEIELPVHSQAEDADEDESDEDETPATEDEADTNES